MHGARELHRTPAQLSTHASAPPHMQTAASWEGHVRLRSPAVQGVTQQALLAGQLLAAVGCLAIALELHPSFQYIVAVCQVLESHASFQYIAAVLQGCHSKKSGRNQGSCRAPGAEAAARGAAGARSGCRPPPSWGAPARPVEPRRCPSTRTALHGMR
jgi:hypothetical protein